MGAVLERLSAVEELQLERTAREGFEYLMLRCPHQSDREGIWAVANNAALVCLSLKEGGRQRFGSVYELLERMSLKEIAELADEYGERFDENREEGELEQDNG